MQNIFLTDSKPEAFRKANEELFPDAPIRCTFEDCRMPVRMKKHGFLSSQLFNPIFPICSAIYPGISEWIF